jgi:anthranilate phosphoribosyltransferase
LARILSPRGNTSAWILYGREKGAKRDLVAVNAGAAFYALGFAEDFKEGTRIAIGQIDKGEAAQAFEEYVKFCGNITKLEELKKKSLS